MMKNISDVLSLTKRYFPRLVQYCNAEEVMQHTQIFDSKISMHVLNQGICCLRRVGNDNVVDIDKNINIDVVTIVNEERIVGL